ncbi:LysR substrate-binding domain-containing protein [Gordonia rhizosphera]|uniref:Putative LysR family transcriptional regulator n=1 Tax=Gordonia rhizosphera NBRC 16068 TaxID=1108045 RepID=K6WGY0_9ACTN|nr:LysR substrate-binding domain-containing protein [Gordonia rhizosphera]GAB91407.1 putative LysR family transcriptional regulator [Gordonia rhizosphera NBRC 16068]
MNEVTLRQMEYLIAVLDHGSVSAGAAAAHVSQATVSASLSQLEKSLGTVLLARGPARRARPTSAGEEFAARARAILTAVDDAVDSVDESGSDLRGPLSVGCLHTASPRMLPGLVAHFEKHWPRVDLELAEETPRRLQDLVATGRLDVAMLYSRQLERHELVTHRLGSVRLHAMLPADSPLARADEVQLAELVRLPAIFLDIPPTAELLLDRIHSRGLDVEVRWRSSSAETIRALVARGLGFSLVNAVPHPGVQSFEGLDVAYRPVAGMEDNPAIAVTIPHRARSRRVAEAIKTLRAIHHQTDPDLL